MRRSLSIPTRLFTGLLAACALLLSAAPAHATKDAVQFGSDIEVGPQEAIHDAVCFFCNVNVRGVVNGDIVVFFGNVHVSGQANHDVVNFFGDVTADDKTSIGHDLVNFFGGVHLGQNVTVGQDTVVMFGGLRAPDSASIGGSRVVEPGWIFWAPFIGLCLGIYFLIHSIRDNRRRRMFGY